MITPVQLAQLLNAIRAESSELPETNRLGTSHHKEQYPMVFEFLEHGTVNGVKPSIIDIDPEHEVLYGLVDDIQNMYDEYKAIYPAYFIE